MLLLKPGCECCDIDLPPDSQDAMICSFECTFCRSRADGILEGGCPNCGGELMRRPIRPAAMLAKIRPRASACLNRKVACPDRGSLDSRESTAGI